MEKHPKSTFTIECCDPSKDATDEILARFDAAEDAESESAVATWPATLLV